MADKVICNKSDLVNIANSVRTKLGVTNPYYVSDLSGAIDSISTGSTPKLQSKSVTYTSNGTSTVTPNSGYDGLSSVDVTVNVAQSGGGEVIEDTFYFYGGYYTFEVGGTWRDFVESGNEEFVITEDEYIYHPKYDAFVVYPTAGITHMIRVKASEYITNVDYASMENAGAI